MNMNPTTVESNNKNPFKLPSLGLFITFKTIVEYVILIIQFAFRGFKFLTIDLFMALYNALSGGVDHAYQKTKHIVTKDNIAPSTAPKKESILNADLSTLFKNSFFMKKKLAKLEAQKIALAEELKGNGAIRSKEPKVFKFTAKNKNGKIESGVISGFSKLDVNTFLVQEEYEVYNIISNEWTEFIYGQTSIFTPKMKTKDLLFWLTQLSTYIKSGITLTDSIKILNNQMGKNKNYKRAFQSIVYELTMGESFSKALEKQGVMFPALLINMIKAAEATGELEETLSDMANYYDEIDKTHKQMISAITYPSVILVFSIAVITFILVFIIPQFVEIYKESEVEINGLTLFIIHMSDFLKENIGFLLIIAIASIAVLIFSYQKVKAFRKSMQTFLMHVPVFGKIMIYNEMAVFAKTFSSLLRNNVFITESIDILSKITNNEIYKEIMYNTINNIVKGEKISEAFKNQWAVPEVAYYMIVTGESTGQLAEMMSKVSSYYQEMHRSIISSLKAFIEPVLITFLAVIVGGIILAVIVPMFNLMNQFG
ncbi:MAG: type II secretion system F family protein [Bacilli bacterium]|jgi:type IV pilus assembly protein PilC|nr:type II secretion system F family protein [Bacilli bacterium]